MARTFLLALPRDEGKHALLLPRCGMASAVALLLLWGTNWD